MYVKPGIYLRICHVSSNQFFEFELNRVKIIHKNLEPKFFWSPLHLFGSIVKVLRKLVHLLYLWESTKLQKKKLKEPRSTKKITTTAPTKTQESGKEREGKSQFILYPKNPYNLTAKILSFFDILLTIVWVSIIVRPKLPSRVCRIGQIMLKSNHYLMRRPLDFSL